MSGRNLGKTERAIIDFFQQCSSQITTEDLRQYLCMTSDQCLSALKRLHKKGLVMNVKNGKELRWTLTPENIR